MIIGGERGGRGGSGWDVLYEKFTKRGDIERNTLGKEIVKLSNLCQRIGISFFKKWLDHVTPGKGS